MARTKAYARTASSSAYLAASAVATVLALAPQSASADENGMSFWLPGIFGSLAAAPLQPGLSFTTFYYHTSVEASGQTARAREISIGQIPATLSASISANLDADVDLQFVFPTYTFATPFLGGQATIGLLAAYGRNNTSLDATLNASLLVGPFALTRSRFFDIDSSVSGFSDLVPQFTLRWNAGVHNYMVYATGGIPVGTYDRTSPANIGIGHGALDGGLGYTYFNPQTGNEFSAVAGFTYNFENSDTDYQSGVDFHLDWAASKFLTKQFQIGVVGYVYDQVSCDSSGVGRIGCFESRVASVGAQLGYIIPMGELQGYFNIKGYKEFEAENRPEGWNVWLTFVLSPAASTPSSAMTTPKSMYMK